MQDHAHSLSLDWVFVVLQLLVVLFLLQHDWMPLGKLNNLGAIRSQDSAGKRLFNILLGGIPATVCLIGSWRAFGQVYPDWLTMMFWITYALFVTGMLRAWWIPYLLLPDPERAARYRLIFAQTHTFLPRRNGIVPDTLHTVFHFVCLATFVVFLIRSYGS